MSATQIDLPIARTTSAQQPRLDPRERDRLIRRAKALSWLSLAYMTAEGAIAITAALLAGSVALLGFGLDSAIEALASVIVIWRFTGTRRLSQDAERRAQRLVAISFFLLAPYIAQDAIRTLIRRRAPPHQLARHRTINLQHHRHAPTRQRQAPHRPAPRIRRNHRRRHPEHALRLPRRRSTHRPRAQRRVRPLVGRPRRRARHRRASPSKKATKPGEATAAAPLTRSTSTAPAPAPTTAVTDPLGVA